MTTLSLYQCPKRLFRKTHFTTLMFFTLSWLQINVPYRPVGYFEQTRKRNWSALWHKVAPKPTVPLILPCVGTRLKCRSPVLTSLLSVVKNVTARQRECFFLFSLTLTLKISGDRCALVLAKHWNWIQESYSVGICRWRLWRSGAITADQTSRVRLQWIGKVNFVVLKAKLLPKKGKESHQNQTAATNSILTSRVTQTHPHRPRWGWANVTGFRQKPYNSNRRYSSESERNGKNLNKTKQCKTQKRKRVRLFGRQVPDGKPVFNRRVAFPDQVGLSLLHL